MPSPEPDRRGAAPPDVHRLTVPSPVGALTVFEEDGVITQLAWAVGRRIRNARPTPLLAEASDQLADYFAGKLERFHLPLAPAGTAFEKRVWQALAKIPFGGTETYGGLAARLKTSPRAVGRACARNPIPIIVPCHRVVGMDGGLHGYSGRGGLATKARLLRLEGARAAR